MANLDVGRIGIVAQGLGIAEADLEYSCTYAKERVQFGKPIGSQQGVAFKLADMATEVETARLLVYRAADMRNRGMNCGKEASMAKLFATYTAMKVAIEAVQIHGGYGYTKEFPVERLFRDAKALKYMKERMKFKELSFQKTS